MPEVDLLWKAMAHPTRRALLDELSERDGQTLLELSARLSAEHGVRASRQAVSQHLVLLADAGLVSSRRVGRNKLHSLETAPLREIAQRWRRSG